MPKRLFLIATLLLAAGCASTDPVRTPRVDLPGAYDARAQAAALALDQWWLAFDDAQLTALITEALTSAPDAQLALARLEEARATRLANIRSAFPTGALNSNATVRGSEQLSGAQSAFQSNGVSNSESVNFDVSWELDVWGKTRIGRRGIDNDFASKVFNIEGSRASLAANVADSLFQARGLAQQLDDAQQSARIAREIQRLTDLRVQRGLVAGGDARRAAADVAQADAGVIQLSGELDAARRSLLVLVGRAGAPLDSLPITIVDKAPPPAPAAIPGELLERRPDVREAKERLEVAIAQLKADRIALFPKFTILPGVGVTRSEQNSFTGFSGSGDPTFGKVSSIVANWSLGAGLSVPVLDRPRLLATARASGARAEQAVIGYEASVQRAFGEADTAFIQYAADQGRLEALARAETDSRAAYEAAQVRYRAGIDDMTSLLSAEQAWRGARQQLTAARAQALRRSVQVFKALGGGWAPGSDFDLERGRLWNR